MYKLYRKNNYNVMHFRFDSITEFITFLNSNPVCSEVFSDPSSISGSYDFTQTHSLEEAIDLCRFGYHKDFNKLIELKMKLEKYVKMSSKKNKQYNFHHYDYHLFHYQYLKEASLQKYYP